MTRQRLLRMPAKRLRMIAAEINTVLRELETASARRDIDIGAEYDGRDDLIYEVEGTRGSQASGRWHQIQTIYCSLAHCPNCPHGPFRFAYYRNKRKKKTRVRFVGIPALPEQLLISMSSDVSWGTPYRALAEERLPEMID